MDSREVSRLEGRLQSYRAGICSLLSDVRATVTAMERITSRYFPGLKILFKSYKRGSTSWPNAPGSWPTPITSRGLYRSVSGRNYFRRGVRQPNTKDRSERNRPGSRESAATMVRNARRLAKAETLLFFDENDRAAEVLKPIVRGETKQAPGPCE